MICTVLKDTNLSRPLTVESEQLPSIYDAWEVVCTAIGGRPEPVNLGAMGSVAEGRFVQTLPRNSERSKASQPRRFTLMHKLWIISFTFSLPLRL